MLILSQSAFELRHSSSKHMHAPSSVGIYAYRTFGPNFASSPFQASELCTQLFLTGWGSWAQGGCFMLRVKAPNAPHTIRIRAYYIGSLLVYFRAILQEHQACYSFCCFLSLTSLTPVILDAKIRLKVFRTNHLEPRRYLVFSNLRQNRNYSSLAVILSSN